MKLLARLTTLALLASPIVASAQDPVTNSTLFNQDPEDCCTYITLTLAGKMIKDTRGNYTATVAGQLNANAPAGMKFGPAGAFALRGPGTVIENTLSGNTSGHVVIQISAKDFEEYNDEWILKVLCEGSSTTTTASPVPEEPAIQGCEINLVKPGCDGESCDSGACVGGEPYVMQDSFIATIPTGVSHGGMASGNLRYWTSTFSNPGTSVLYANLPSDYIVTRDGQGRITSVDTGAGTMLVAPADAGLLALDPNAFTVTHKDAAGATFRTTTISFVTEGGIQRLRMDTTFDGSTTRYEQTNPQPNTYILEKGRVIDNEFQPLSQETLTKQYPHSTRRIHRRITRERPEFSANLAIVSDISTAEVLHLRRWLKVEEVIDPDGAALTSTWSYYVPGMLTGPNGSTIGMDRVKQHVRYDGYESFHTYSNNQWSTTTPYAGNPTGKVMKVEWDAGTRTRTTTETVNGIVHSKTTTTHTDTSYTQTVFTSASATLTTTVHQVPSGQDFGGMPVRVIHPDNTLTTYIYTRNEGGGYTTVMDRGARELPNGSTVTKGTRTTTTTNSRGTSILDKTEAIGSGTGSAVFGSMSVTSVDSLGRALSTAYHSPSPSVAGEVATALDAAWTTTTAYSCCGIAKETDQYGVPTYHAYDHLQRPIKTNRLGVTTETVRKGALGDDSKPVVVTETHRYPESVEESLSPASYASAANLVSRSVSNLAGTIQESWSPDPTPDTRPDPINDPPRPLIKSAVTATTYKPAAGLSSRTITTTPDNFTQTTDSFLDDRTSTTYGDLSPDMTYSYSVNATGEVTSQSYVDGSNLRETTTTQSDWAGRNLSTTFMDGSVATVHYNSKGQMVRSVDPDQIVTLYAYNEEGERTTSATDLFPSATYNDEEDNIQYGVDTVTFSETDPAMETMLAEVGPVPVMKTISKVWQPGESNSAGGTIVSVSLRSANGLRSSSQSISVANPSTSLTTLAGNGNWTTTQTNPDGTQQVETYAAGLLASSASLLTSNSVLHTTSYAYDALNRAITQTDSRTGASTTAYLSNTTDVVKSVTASGNRTTAFTYDLRGRQISVNAPDSVDADGAPLYNVTTTSYNPDSTVAETTGDQTYRTTHTYDYGQRQVTMTTYGSTTATTYWHYSPTRGFLTRKAYHDGKGTDYTYTAAGRLSSRGWARAVGTSYAYDNAGRLITTTYSDDTPDVAVTYDALGRQLSQTNGTAITTYAYDSATLRLDTETVSYDLNNDNTPDFTRIIDRSQDNLGRDTGWQLKDGTTIDNSVTYAYGATDGRLASVSGGGLQPPSPFNYSYLPNSNLLHTVTGPTHTVTNTWEADRNVLASKENKVDTTVISSYTYSVNSFGQRTGVNKAGAAFPSTRTIDWGYNAKGEVVKADSSVTGSDRAYQYDGIGNRLKSADSLTLPTSNNYIPNVLNQYTAVGTLNPGYDDDGNATAYPLPAHSSANSALTWDAENRLISATVNSTTTTYLYDSQSRRIATTTGSATTLYVYDGWNPIAEYSGTTLTKTYTWGMDLSGSMQGAGGVGGLLAGNDNTGNYFPTFDGNGNVSEYLDATGAIAAHYEYDPFGRETVSNGTKAGDFAHRFSTKTLDSATGLYYYGYRYYDPVTGSWPSRDPIEEKGGINLYGFVRNNPVSIIDDIGNRPLVFPREGVIGESLCMGFLTGCSNTGKKKRNDKGYWRDGEHGEYHSSKCMIPIFIGHNHVVPQGEIHDDPNGCSYAGVVSCGNLGFDIDGNPTTDPASPTIPGAPNNSDGIELNGFEVERYVRNNVEAAKKAANEICNKKICCCKWVTIVLHVWSDLPLTDEYAGYPERIPIKCK